MCDPVSHQCEQCNIEIQRCHNKTNNYYKLPMPTFKYNCQWFYAKSRAKE